MRKRILRYLQRGTAWLLLLMGSILLISPIPIGVFFIAIGLTLLIYSSETVQHKIHGYRKNNSKFHRKLVWLENNLEHRINFISFN